jgi:hypothetical protein
VERRGRKRRDRREEGEKREPRFDGKGSRAAVGQQ